MTPDGGAWSGGLHHLPVRVYYEDTDFTGVVYYANYLKFLERGRTDALRMAGVSHSDLLALDPPLGFAVRQLSVEYLAPARIDDALVVETRFETARGARMVIAQRILRGDAVLLTAQVEAACIDLDGRPRRLPAVMVDAIARASSRGG
ncbi:tol-pal system-associated acyl-CoA thioesterase [Alkalicaulis satelles]|uniref:Tol-pal system-associated acyl-CoA thioesterase n=1 Tax=Alkalicaulis satelles TaxID=2609175 RepID=A0A5M6ZDF4_9PROT|nr:tol-pal system-associated acyl-CoA thioesterase [Alkalicaulis satelles]KAA5802345.1 tol-pal system-associated acyl-CoA thioesterase [Alkalicaulis satelles]